MHGLSAVDPGCDIDWGRTARDYAAWRPDYPVEFYDRLAALGIGGPGQHILDLATGVGFLALNFALRGAIVTGIDIAPAQIQQARETAAAFPSDPFAQYELGLAHARRNDMAEAAQAFDRATQADPRFAYAYYSSGLVWDKLDRADLTIARLEMFERLAPDAPERPEVASILQTVRSR